MTDGAVKKMIVPNDRDFRLLFEAMPGSLLVVLPDAPRFTMVAASDAYLRRVGKSRDELLGAGLFETLAGEAEPMPTATFENLLASFERVLASRLPDSLPTQQYNFVCSGGGQEKRFCSSLNSPVAGEGGEVKFIVHRVEDAEEPTRVAGIGVDIAEHQRPEDVLRAVYPSTYEYLGLSTPDGTLLDVNRAWLEFAGGKHEGVAGLPFWEGPWFAWTPEASMAAREAFERAAAGEFVRYRETICGSRGERSIFDISLRPIRDTHGKVILIVQEGRDRGAPKAFESHNAFLVRLDDALRDLADPQAITHAAARLLGEHLQVSRCAYANLLDAEEEKLFGEELLDAMPAGEALAAEDSETDGRRNSATDRARKWREDEVELVRLVSNRCGESIERASLTGVPRERERYFRFLAESIPQMLWTASPDGKLSYLSRQGLSYLGVNEQELLGSGWLTVVHEDDRQAAFESWTHSLTNRTPYEVTYRLRRHDGLFRWHLVRGMPMLDSGGAVVEWHGTCTDIEDQKQAEENLQQQWQTFDTALSHSPDSTYIFDRDCRFRYANQPLLAILGKSYAEVIGHSLIEAGFPAGLARALKVQIKQVIRTQQPVRGQITFPMAAGEIREYEHIFVPVMADDGTVRAVTGSSRDITHQVLAEKQIQQDRKRWQDLLQRAPAAIALLSGREHRFEWVNPEFVRLAGRSTSHQLLGKTLPEALPEVVSQGYVEVYDDVFASGQPRAANEARVSIGEAAHLRELFVNFVCMPTVNAHGQVDGTFVHATDVTDLVRARKQIEERERQFRTLAETIPHLTWMARPDGHIFWYNQRWYDYTGTTPEEMEGWGWRKVHDPEVLPRIEEQWKRCLKTGEPFDTTFPLRAANGTFRTFLTRVEPVKDNGGEVVRWFGTNTDITDQKRVEEELRRINGNLEEFSYVASHDLQEPLRMVNIYSQLMLKAAGETQGNFAQYAGFVRQGVARMEALVRDLLTFSRSINSEEIPTGTADLSNALGEALAVLKNRIDESGAIIHVPVSLPLVVGDTTQLAHVFQNLLSNALKYAKRESAPEICITVNVETAHCEVSVADNGIGFEQKYAERIFGLFKRLHKDNYPGTGLGLAICKRIVERYGGRMWAVGIPDQGATFYFTLPLANGA